MDADGWGLEEVQACPGTEGLVDRGGDCDDQDATVNPEAEEACDGRDQDCDGEVDEGLLVSLYRDEDLDGWGVGPAEALCAHAQGYVDRSGDCDDARAEVSPEGTELCFSGLDEDCDGLLDCEDDACAEVCVELSCEDGLDEDQDGLTDCQDEDCWPLDHCITGLASVVTGGAIDFFTLRYPSFISGTFTAVDLEGELRVYGPWGTSTCTWSRPGTWVGYTYGQYFYHPGTLAPATASSACRVGEVPWPEKVYAGPGGTSVIDSQGLWLVPNSTAWTTRMTTGSSVYARVTGALTTGEPFLKP